MKGYLKVPGRQVYCVGVRRWISAVLWIVGAMIAGFRAGAGKGE